MKVYITSAESELLLLQQQASTACISGQLAIAQSYITRANAEHIAGMEKDAFITLVAFDRQVRKIRCVNQYINDQLGCGLTHKNIVLKRWYDEGDFNQCEKATSSPVIAKEGPIAEPKRQFEKSHLIITETLHDFNQAEIKPIYYQSLNKLVELINSYPNATLLISGHADTIGTTQYNKQLSKRRAQNVKKYFTDKGIEASRIVLETKGEENIREVEKSDVSRVFNRYTSITLFLDTSEKSNI
ncbi:OmpA family protein [Colwellia psychrerythraea]|nr:OmpA family protein [Colwellia psychrerythraea]